MPAWAERKMKKQGGVKKYRSMKKGGKTFTVAVTRKAGPKGGHSVAWRRKKK